MVCSFRRAARQQHTVAPRISPEKILQISVNPDEYLCVNDGVRAQGTGAAIKKAPPEP
jgi:hypothetical protein